MEIEDPSSSSAETATDSEAADLRGACYACTGCAVGTTLLLMCILLPLSFSGVEYFEYGLRQRKSTSTVSLDKVYSAGLYNTGPDTKFKRFQADAHHVQFNSESVFSQGTNESIGLEFKLDIDFTYKLIENELPLLHEELERRYHGVVESRARDAIKNVGVNIPFDNYFKDRLGVEKKLRDALDERLKPLHMELMQFFLGKVQIPEEVSSRQLEAKVQNERNEQESNIQAAQKERDITLVQVNEVTLESDKIQRIARGSATLIEQTSKVRSEQIERDAALQGLGVLYNSIGITDAAEKASLDYIRTILKHDTASLSVSYISNERAQPVSWTPGR